MWIELSLDTTPEAVDWVCTLLAEVAYHGDIHIADIPITDHLAESSSPWAFTLYLYLPPSARSQTQAIAQKLSPLHRTGIASELQVRQVEEKITAPQFAYPIGEKFLLSTRVSTGALPHPEGKHGGITPTPSRLLLQIPPTLAFGSGLHPATRLCLQRLENHVHPGMKALDLGTGTGILSVAIAKLGAQVVAVDNDAIAVQAAQSTVNHNGVAPQVTVMAGSLGQGSQLGHWMGGDAIEQTPVITATDFDLIAANLLGRIHVTLAPAYRQALKPSGLLITAGFTDEYEETIVNALGDAGFELMECDRSGEWIGLVLRLI